MKRYPIGVTRTRIRVIAEVNKWNVDQGKGNLGRVSEEFELSEPELTEYKRLKSGMKSKGNGT